MSDVKRGFLITCVYDWVILGVILEIDMDESEILRKFNEWKFQLCVFYECGKRIGSDKMWKIIENLWNFMQN